MRRRRLLAPLLLVAVVGGACGGDDGRITTITTASTATRTDALDGTVTVLAAASLTGAFGEIADAFEVEHPGVDVALSFDGSARLATAILEGAPADVFASADETNAENVVEAGLADGDPVPFATNVLQIVVADGNPLGISGLADLTGDLRLSLCQAAVPCGSYAAQAFERAGLALPPAGDQENVKGVLTQVQLGEADAGIVYVTDVLAAEGVEGVDLAADQQVQATYPAVALRDAPEPEAAAAFLAFLTGDAAQAILARYGFGAP